MVDIAIEQFNKINNQGAIDMDIIKRWLDIFSMLYRELDKQHSEMYLVEINGENVRLPPMNLESSLETKFLTLYDELFQLDKLHSKEKYFKDEIQAYNIVQKDDGLTNDWLNKNEVLGTEDYVCFLIDYLDYSDDSYHLQIKNSIDHSKSIFIDRKSFQYTIEFLEIFNRLYWSRFDE